MPKKTYAPPPGRDPLSAMIVGGDQAPAGPLVPADARAAADLLPGDLRVTMEGATPHRVGILGGSVLALAVLAMEVFGNAAVPPTGAQTGAFYAALLGGCALVGGLGYRLFARCRREYRLTDEGLVLQAWYGAGRTPWVTDVPWTEIEEYTASATPDAATLRVVSVRGYTLTLHDRPPRLSTRELIRRFVQQAEQHPRAVRPPSAAVRVSSAELEEEEGFRRAAVKVLAALLAVVAAVDVGNRFSISPAQMGLRLAAVALVGFALYLWSALDDPDVAWRDGTSRKRMARLRRWLRKVLGMQRA